MLQDFSRLFLVAFVRPPRKEKRSRFGCRPGSGSSESVSAHRIAPLLRAMRRIGWCPINTYGGHDFRVKSVFRRHRDRQLEPSSDRSWGSSWYYISANFRSCFITVAIKFDNARELHSDAPPRETENATRWFSDLCIVCVLWWMIVYRL